MSGQNPLDLSAVVAALKHAVPSLSAVYALGSQVSGDAGTQSDLDIALMSDALLDAEALWDLSSRLALVVDCHVDLLDLRAASTVMQYRIVTTGKRLWSRDEQAAVYESFISVRRQRWTKRVPGCLRTFRQQGLSMVDDVLIDKAATIERCVMRAREEYEKSPATFADDRTRQDAAILNVQRAGEAALDMGQHLMRRERLGIPQSSRDVFALLAHAGWIDAAHAGRLQKMAGFRIIAVHGYQALQLPIVEAVIAKHLGDFTGYSKALLLKDAKQAG